MSLVSHSASQRHAKAIAPSVDDVLGLIADRNGGRRDLLARKTQLSPLIRGFLKAVTAILNDTASSTSVADEAAGEGLATPLPAGEGARRLAAYATPVRIEDWAGEVAGPSDLAKDYGISRSTLHDWQKRGAVVGLLAGSRKHAFPVAQFIDGRPLEGLGKVVAAAGSPRTAWLWLLEPHPSLAGRRPLDRLRRGDLAKVSDLAERDFGQA